MYGLLKTLLVGFVIGLLARAIMPGEQRMSILMTTVLGVLGSFAGGAVASLAAGQNPLTDFQPAGWIGSILGALALMFIGARVGPMLRR